MGRTLTVTPGHLRPRRRRRDLHLAAQRDPVAGVTGRTYDLGAADVGKQISVQVKLSHIGYRDRIADPGRPTAS